MNNKISEFESQPQWFKRIFPLFALVFVTIIFSYVWFRYNKAPLEINNWIRLIMIAIIGITFSFSCLVYFFNKELSWKLFIGGFTLIPVLLFLQLVLLIIKILKSVAGVIFTGSIPEPIKIFIENYPSKFDIIILAVLFIILVTRIIKKLKI